MAGCDDFVDPAYAVITTVINAFKLYYDPDSDCPPRAGGTKEVHFVSGEGPGWDPMAGRMGEDAENSCSPFLWVRVMQRYRSTAFPEATLINPCGGVDVLQVELGVGRCVDISPTADWDAVHLEAVDQLDDMFRLEQVICIVKGELRDTAEVASEPIIPEGPMGGGLAVTAGIYIGITS